MIRNTFFEDSVFTSMGEVQQRELRRTLKKVAEFEESTGQSLEDGFTREQYVALFNSMKIRRTYYLFHFKILLTKYVHYLMVRIDKGRNCRLPERGRFGRWDSYKRRKDHTSISRSSVFYGDA